MDLYIPVDILFIIARMDIQAYKALLAIPAFARSALYNANYIDRVMIPLGYSITIRRDTITWCLNGKAHRVNGPAVEHIDAYRWS
jgi:hypothetical protein